MSRFGEWLRSGPRGPEVIKVGGKQPPNAPPPAPTRHKPPPAPKFREETVTINLGPTEVPCPLRIGDRTWDGVLVIDHFTGTWSWRRSPDHP